MAKVDSVAGNVERGAGGDEDHGDVGADLKCGDAVVDDTAAVEHLEEFVARAAVTGGLACGGEDDGEIGHGGK